MYHITQGRRFDYDLWTDDHFFGNATNDDSVLEIPWVCYASDVHRTWTAEGYIQDSNRFRFVCFWLDSSPAPLAQRLISAGPMSDRQDLYHTGASEKATRRVLGGEEPVVNPWAGEKMYTFLAVIWNHSRSPLGGSCSRSDSHTYSVLDGGCIEVTLTIGNLGQDHIRRPKWIRQQVSARRCCYSRHLTTTRHRRGWAKSEQGILNMDVRWAPRDSEANTVNT
ncbi:hypothetical protein EV421DRAFT_1206429 [Armillaria borealis]|uniref:Uncharacterized protein n=1 Tax=Armillaria borealis TaxID=47425 RepID=A0AA39K2H6_9AGAR|nr:hypothetical protein EV421DRAFT_1206429 [Armillaria borealis]